MDSVGETLENSWVNQRRKQLFAFVSLCDIWFLDEPYFVYIYRIFHIFGKAWLCHMFVLSMCLVLVTKPFRFQKIQRRSSLSVLLFILVVWLNMLLYRASHAPKTYAVIFVPLF